MTAKAGPRRRPAPRDEEPEDDYEDDGILRLGEDEAEKPRHEVLFRLDGKEYEAVANPSASLMLRYLDRLRKWGPNPAISWLLEEMVGAEGYEALLTSPKVTQKDFAAVTRAAVRIVMGDGETGAPKSRTSR